MIQQLIIKMRIWRGPSAFGTKNRKDIKVSITTKLILSFLLIIVMTSAIFTAVGILLINSHIEDDAREQTQDDLEEARESYLEKLNQISKTVRSTAVSFMVREAILLDDMDRVSNELRGIRIRETLDVLAITDENGEVLLIAGGPNSCCVVGQNQLVNSVINNKMATASTTVTTLDEVRTELPAHSEEAAFTDGESAGAAIEESMVIAAAAPVLSSKDELIGVVYGGVRLNENFNFVCEIKQGVYKNEKYAGQEIGLVTIYQNGDDILSCPRLVERGEDTSLAIPDDVFSQVIDQGNPWSGRVDINDRRYVSVFEPIKDSQFETVGMLQVARLEQMYLDINRKLVVAFVTITVIGALLAIIFAYFISRQISVPLKQLVAASRKVAKGDLDARVNRESMSNDELGEMADAFNAMTFALEERDAQLRELTQSRIHRSERLALIGKLSADIAHELNNPLQGIVTYSHLILEEMPADHPTIRFVDVIMTQADRCREIIRGLLDFARQREPDRSPDDINFVIQKALSFLENQALFQNVQIELDLDPELPLATIDSSQMERVFVNLMINAAEAMEGEGILTLLTEYDVENNETIISVSDSGCGMTEEEMRKIFDPFFTTKEVGQGTGLGLALSYGIIAEHDGQISVESEVGVGTTFTIRLPASVEEAVPVIDG